MNKTTDRSSELLRRLSAEFVIIVAGVLIALAIDEWRASIEESERATTYVRQLIADLEKTEVVFAEAAPVLSAASNSAESLLEILEQGNDVGLARLRELLDETRIFNNPVPVLGTIEALISTGDLRLIPEPDDRVRITEYLSYVRDYWLPPLYDLEDNHRVLYRRLRILAAQCGIYPGGTNHASGGDETCDPSGFISNSEAYVVLAEIVQMKHIFRQYDERISGNASALRLALESSLGERE